MICTKYPEIIIIPVITQLQIASIESLSRHSPLAVYFDFVTEIKANLPRPYVVNLPRLPRLFTNLLSIV